MTGWSVIPLCAQPIECVTVAYLSDTSTNTPTRKELAHTCISCWITQSDWQHWNINNELLGGVSHGQQVCYLMSICKCLLQIIWTRNVIQALSGYIGAIRLEIWAHLQLSWPGWILYTQYYEVTSVTIWNGNVLTACEATNQLHWLDFS